MALRTSYADGEVLNAADVNAITTKVNQIDDDMVPKSGGTMTGPLSTTAGFNFGNGYVGKLYINSSNEVLLGLFNQDGTRVNMLTLGEAVSYLQQPLGVNSGGTGSKTAEGACQSLGAVKKNGDTMTNRLQFNHALWPIITVKTDDIETFAITRNPATGRVTFDCRDLDATGYDRYGLPAPASGQATDKWYTILTTKNPVALAQGGFGRGFASEAELKSYLKTLLGI